MAEYTITGESISDVHTRTVRIDVEGVPDLTRRYASTQTMRPNRLTITFVKHDEGPWRIQSFMAFGPRILKNGREGEVLKEDGWFNLTDAPLWVRGLVESRLADLNGGQQL